MNYTKEQVKFNIAADQKWLERAIQVIYLRQTIDERRTKETKHVNGIGFNSADAKYLSYLAQWLNEGKFLSGKHLVKARKMMPKYAGQILEIINDKQKSKKSIA